MPIEHPGMIHFSEIVVFCREPENCHGRYAAVTEFLCEFGRRYRFENRVSGTGKQSNLLTCDNGHGSGLSQFSESIRVAVLLPQGRNQCRST